MKENIPCQQGLLQGEPIPDRGKPHNPHDTITTTTTYPTYSVHYIYPYTPVHAGYFTLLVKFSPTLIPASSGFFNGSLSSWVTAQAIYDTARMQTVMNIISFQLRDFNVLPTIDTNAYNKAPIGKRHIVVITTDDVSYPFYSGISSINSAFTNNPSISLVFANKLYGNANYIGEIAAHESGHAVGLYHQESYDANCNVTAYYAPLCIMGYPFYLNPLIQQGWKLGQSWGCTIWQDDRAMLLAVLGPR